MNQDDQLVGINNMMQRLCAQQEEVIRKQQAQIDEMQKYADDAMMFARAVREAHAEYDLFEKPGDTPGVMMYRLLKCVRRVATIEALHVAYQLAELIANRLREAQVKP
jgi:hypothetical protein